MTYPYGSTVYVCLPPRLADGLVPVVVATMADRVLDGYAPPNDHGDPLVRIPIAHVLAFRAAFAFLEDPAHPWETEAQLLACQDLGAGAGWTWIEMTPHVMAETLPEGAIPWDLVGYEPAM